jgi:RNA polymerase sigma-70 factor (ECF subfamily)
MSDEDLAAAFEQHRSHLRAVAYRMLGSTGEADDAVQDAWLRASAADTDDVRDLRAWLTTVTARVCLNVLRTRRRHDDQLLDVQVHVPDPVVRLATTPAGPEEAAELADDVSLAVLVVLETLSPPERLAFVLHDVFGLPFEEIAPLVERSPAATRQLASRARRRVRGAEPTPSAGERDLAAQRAVVDAFFAAARGGDFDGLLRLLDPDVRTQTDRGPVGSTAQRGAEQVASGALTYFDPLATLVPVIVNGGTGMLVLRDGRAIAVMAFVVQEGRITRVDALADLDRLAGLALPPLDVTP